MRGGGQRQRKRLLRNGEAKEIDTTGRAAQGKRMGKVGPGQV